MDDPSLFISHYFKHRLDRLEDFHLRLIRNATEEPLALILYPAQFGKTTLVSTLLPIYQACRNPDILIGLIAKNDSESSSISSSIQAELVTNTELIRDFGQFRPTSENKPWAAEKMTIDQRTLIAKEPTFAFFGANSKHTLGHRTNWTVCDDVVTAENSATPEVRAKMRGWFNKSVRTMNLPGGRTTVVGTLFDPGDLYNDLMELTTPDDGKQIWAVQREDALPDWCECDHMRADHELDELQCRKCGCHEFVLDEQARKTLWPERWPYKSIMQLKAEMGTLDFNKRMRNIAVDASRMVFKEEYVRGGYVKKIQFPGCLDKNYVVGEYEENWRRIAGFDPAAGRGRSAKFCAHLTLGLGSCPKHERCVWVIDLLREQLALPQQVDHIIETHQKYDLFKSIIEANSYQIGLYDAIKQRMDEQGLAFMVEPHYTTRINKVDPEVGVHSMSPWFENGWVHIPWGNPESQRKMQYLVDELIQYPGRTTDTVMAFWFAWHVMRTSAPKYKTSNYLRHKGSAWQSLGQRRRVIINPYFAKQNG